MEKCTKCNSVVEENANFCPQCGEPLTTIAESIRKEQRRGAMLEIINVLLNNIKDAETLNVIEQLVNTIKSK